MALRNSPAAAIFSNFRQLFKVLKILTCIRFASFETRRTDIDYFLIHGQFCKPTKTFITRINLIQATFLSAGCNKKQFHLSMKFFVRARRQKWTGGLS